MSRHRNVRNLVEDDYYDGYDDDYYDDEDYYDDYDYNYAPKQAPAPSVAAAKPKATTYTAQLVAPKSTTGSKKNTGATVSSGVGVTKAPPGWGKPSAVAVSVPPPQGPPPGIAKPPAGWGKPAAGTKGGSGDGGNATAKTAGGSAKPRTKSPKRQAAAPYVPKPLPAFVGNQTSQLSMVILGHVDAGKSTLMGQILVQTNQVSKRDAAKQANLSWLLDENESERARGVTMELGTKTLRVPRHDIVVLDAPGHHDFIPV